MSIDNMDERPGCLGTLLGLFRPPSKEAQILSAYSKAKSLLSEDEQAFLEALKTVVGSRFAILIKMRQADIFETKHSSYSIQTTAFNKVAKKHVDFLLCEPGSFAPVLIIELDGGSHNRQDRKARDAFLDAICTKVNLRILHYPGARRYDPQGISEAIVAAFKPTE